VKSSTSIPLHAALLLALVHAAPAAGQDSRLARRLDGQTAAAVSRLVETARTRGLPTEPLVQKALEGAAMSAAPERITDAVAALLGRLTDARASLGDDASAAELVVAAAALDVGAGAADLRRLAGHRAGHELTYALLGLTYLLQRGVPAAGSLEIVVAMLEAKLTPSDFVSLQRLVDQDVRSGVAPAEAARVRARALIRIGPQPRRETDP
jgi:hypothetical protein